MQRRTYLTGLAGAIGSIGFVVTQSNTSQAQSNISFGELTIPDQSTYTNGQTVEDITLSVDAHYSYDTPVQPTRVCVTLAVGTGVESLYPIAEHTQETKLATQSDGTETLSGSIVDTPAYSLQQFQMDSDGAQASSTLIAELTLGVTVNGEETTTSVRESAQLTVTNGTPTIDTQLGGTGEIDIEMD